jgi:hypothetical protein
VERKIEKGGREREKKRREGEGENESERERMSQREIREWGGGLRKE